MKYSFTTDEKNLLYFFLFAIFTGAGLSMADSPASGWSSGLSRREGGGDVRHSVFSEIPKARKDARRKVPESPKKFGNRKSGKVPTGRSDLVSIPGALIALPESPVDLNAASEEAMADLPGIGPVRAAAIARARKESGAFQTLEALLAVRGIGRKTLSRIEGLAILPSPAVAGPSVGLFSRKVPVVKDDPGIFKSMKAAPGMRVGVKADTGEFESRKRLSESDKHGMGEAARFRRIDLNSATREDLRKVKGIGPVIADRIVIHRDRHGPFKDFFALARVKGIKRHKAALLRKMLFVSEIPKPGSLCPVVGVGQESMSMRKIPEQGLSGSGIDAAAGQVESSLKEPAGPKTDCPGKPWLEGYRRIPKIWPELCR